MTIMLYRLSLQKQPNQLLSVATHQRADTKKIKALSTSVEKAHGVAPVQLDINPLGIIQLIVYSECVLLSTEDPCNYNDVVELDTADRSIKTTSQDPYLCDYLELDFTKWHKFTGAAGTEMATKCQLGARCGGHVAGWLQESHPQPQDGIVEKKVCLTFGVNCCKWNLKIKVRNCGSFNLYKLKAPAAFCTPNYYWRFCGNGQSGEQ